MRTLPGARELSSNIPDETGKFVCSDESFSGESAIRAGLCRLRPELFRNIVLLHGFT